MTSEPDHAALRAELEALRMGFHSSLQKVETQVAAMRDELHAETAGRNTRWAIHDERHRSWEEAHLEARVDALEDWKIEMVTLGRLVKLTFGASLVGAVAAILALWETLGHVIYTGG